MKQKLAKRTYDKYHGGKVVSLGYVHIESWERGNRIFPDYMFEELEYKKEIESTLPNELVLAPNKEYKLVIDYPLTVPAVFEIKTGTKGLTRAQIIEKVVKFYHKIYKEEDKSVGHKTGHIPGMFNRQKSEGKYGIWGHDISDLMLGSLILKSGNKLELSVDS